MKFNKSPFTISQQISHIKTKFKCHNSDKLEKYLLHYNYYRLRGYWLFFEEIDVNIEFNEVISLYNFDSELRTLFLKYIEKIEISIKSIFAYHLTTKYNNSHIHLDKTIFLNEEFYNNSIFHLQNSFNSSKELFAKHFKNYNEILPPLWASVEIMTFGEISKWYSNLNIKDRKEISIYYNISQKSLYTFLIHLTEVRNLCAHHNRLWNKRILKSFSIPKKFNIIVYNQKFKIYHTAIMMDYILNFLDNNRFFDEFIELIIKYQIPLKYMGFKKEHNIEKLNNINYEYKREI